MAMTSSFSDHSELSLGQKLLQVNWVFVLLICVTASIGFAMLYSAANGSLNPWASRQMVRFVMGLVLMLCVALVDIRMWLKYAYVIYFVALMLLAAVDVMGVVGMGARRWLSLGFINLQPSELMKIAMVLALARYFHGISADEVARPTLLIPPVLMVAAPVGLVLRQPDLGTAMLIMLASAAIMFAAGVRIWKFVVVGVAGLGALPVVWHFMHAYQRQRILTFLNPESDPLGAGYHIIQSKIALGSGGLLGKGFMQGTQSHLSFLPERQTDFIFTMLAEEFGMIGGLGLLCLYVILIAFGYVIALRSRSQFGRLLGIGITTTFFLYVFINIAMVTGLIPVVGVPLPLISYGGTAMLTLMMGFGFLLCVHIHRDVQISRRGADDGI